ncbi:synaptotagmin-like protein 2 isoform X10 [Anguilla rostrata]|uniref:synaptotagmin-like protein 2 isoform X10 n=1 Tax=Anguilla rostrata TaxID=7938 RepID=UPI0030D2010A
MIDLSHLTEEEQEMIVSVLKRDAELKKADEERIRRLRKAAQDTGKLKYLTGEWFYQTKSQRHRDRIHGSDIIRAAMKQRKPMTILEITQIWAERPSFVNSEIQDIFVPAELSGLIEEPSTQATEKRASGSVSPDVQKDGVILALQSPPKIRRNPFNSVLVGSEASEEPEPQFTNWEAEPITPSDEELLPPSKSPIGNLDKITSEDAGTLEAALPITTPLPQKRTVVHPPLDSLSYNNELFPKWSSVAVERSTVSVAPRGILKRSSSCSSADLPAFCIDRDDGGCSESTDSQKAQQPEKNDRPAQRSESLHSLDRKQVRFSTTVRMSETEEGSTLLADGEFGEHDLLDMQCETFPDEERGECKLGIGSFMGESNNDLTHHGAECQHEYSSESCTQGSEDQKGCDESQSPVKALKQICARPIAVSRSLGDITSQQTLSPVSTSPSSSFSDQDQMKKRCASMPAFLHGEMDGRDSDSDSENSFHLGGRKSSASTNFSTSSGMASMSSASSSLMSIYSLEFENVEVKGTIQFALSYVQKLGELHVFVVRCRDLAVADNKKNRSDPYVKSYLLPDKAKLGKKKTTVKKKTLNPIYNEILRYKIDVKTLKSHTLNLSVWHHNSFGKNSFLGEVDFKLSEWDLTNTHMNDFTLKGKSPSGLQPTDHRGEIRVALRFLQQGSHGKRTPKTGLVQIFVKDCKNLPFIRGAVIDPFVKCYVLPDTSRKSRQKSRVLRKTANPVFNHTMVYDGFRAEDLEEACVELTVWDHDRLNNHFLGGVRLSLGTGRSHGAVVDWMDSNAAEAMLWKQMMESHNEWVEDVLPLRMLMMAHSMSK